MNSPREAKPILLSICIPTYNRAALLKDTLSAVADQIDTHSDICELIISDNASEDETGITVQSYQKRYRGIRYFVSPHNVGGRQNIWKVTAYASGKYIWILGDDDMPTPGAVSHILGILSDPSLATNLKLLVLNSMKVRDNFSKAGNSWGELFALQKIEITALFSAGLEILKIFPIKELGFISALVVERESWLKSSYTDYPKSWMYPHLYSLVELAAMGASCYSPRICTLSQKSDQSWCLDRGVFTYCYEFPVLYELAISKGFPKQKASNFIREIWPITVKQYVKMLMFDEVYHPSLQQVKKYHGGFWYFWAIIWPIHFIFKVDLVVKLAREFAFKIKPNLLVPRTSVEFEV